MRYVSARTSWALFAVAVVLLVYLGVATDRTTNHFADSAQWVSHTREVETNLEKVRADLYAAESGRLGFILSGNPEHEARYEKARLDIPQELAILQSLTRDNPREQERLVRLGSAIESRLALLKESMALRRSGKEDRERQDQFTTIGIQRSSEALAFLDQMKEEEGQLLEQRRRVSQQTYFRTRAILAFAFLAVIVLFFANFWQLLLELRDRKRAEESVRRLSGRILQLQDAERRKVARELHDSIGQYFAGLKMTLEMLQANNLDPERKSKLLSQSLQLSDQGMAETRTISHLLHPPLLDEVGFVSAATWFVEGFSQRSKIAVTVEMPEEAERMPRDLELALFRVLQEGLTNVHRHSGSKSALVRMEIKAGMVKLIVRDYGKGVSPSLLAEFRRTSTGSGVGLAGMRERVVELGGQLEVDCDGQGTCLQVTAPLPREATSVNGGSGPEAEHETQKAESDVVADSQTTGLLLGYAHT